MKNNINWSAAVKTAGKVMLSTSFLLALNQTINSAAEDCSKIVKPKDEKPSVK
jgi:hypothetical protein